ncbi:hypothetical protein BGZ70_006737 [Mortierella alpina]|uniref:Farnesyl pyrophosphate synthase n=1 Tax=Mortierella alpina TaxID=64518 RepID=A0A9P6M3P1_MORAP|nr:hypothetical protein BGZ70_006737 [Mortierella alpina]
MNRGLAVARTLRLLKCDGPVSEDEIFKTNLLGWCVEWLPAFSLVADDIMDNSQTRHGRRCWYRSCIFWKEAYYEDLLELFHDMSYKSELGQLTELMSTVEQEMNLSQFSMERYKFIVKHKTAYYSFYLPVALAMHMTGVKEEAAFKEAEYFQVQDDYLNVYGDPTVTGKIGTDIEDNKGTWLIIQALAKATLEQRKILDENYGHRGEVHVQAVKEVYDEIDVQSLFRAYEDESYHRLKTLIAKVDNPRLNPDVFT